MSKATLTAKDLLKREIEKLKVEIEKNDVIIKELQKKNKEHLSGIKHREKYFNYSYKEDEEEKTDVLSNEE